MDNRNWQKLLHSIGADTLEPPPLGTPTEEQPRRCWLFHRWSKWRTIREGNLHDHRDDTVVGYFIEQRRRCLHCGLVKFREERI